MLVGQCSYGGHREGATRAGDDLGDGIVLPEPVPDPLEPLNRAIWSLNKSAMTRVIGPSARVYRRVVIRPIRTGIGNFGRNAAYPGRLLNHLLQGEGTRAWTETERFFCNTTVGVLGFMDVATRWKIPSWDADFGQTFGQWGWDPNCFVMLPIFGPSNERDALGLAADRSANPLTYLRPYPFVAGDPMTYLSPYAYYSFVVMYNDLADSVDGYSRFIQTEQDAYSELQYAWTFVRKNRVADFTVKGEADPVALETLESVFFTFEDMEFPNRGKSAAARMPATGKRMKFNYWLQPGRAPVVFIVPGLGSHRLSETVLALAELVYQKGFSVVSVSSPFNYEFMERASSAALPAYTPVDADDLEAALGAVQRRLEGIHPGRMGRKALMGYSMGAFHSLFLTAQSADDAGKERMKFDRIVAINTPVRMLHGISKLDEFYQAPTAWAEGERTANIENTFLKVAALTKNSMRPRTTLPFDAVESQFLIGLTFRLILRDVIYSSQRRNNQGVLKQQVQRWRRAEVYDEILQYSFAEYLEKFVVPYYQGRGVDLSQDLVRDQATDLRSHSVQLAANPDIRLILSRNDFLLAPEDLEWVRTTFKPENVKIFERGGHLGNLNNPAVQEAIVEALEDLK